MDTSPDFVFSAAWLAMKVILFGTLGLWLATLGNPRELRESVNSFNALNSWPPTTVFRWRKRNPFLVLDQQERDGYDAIVYNAVADKEEVKRGAYQPNTWSPTILLWRKKGVQSKDAMLRMAAVVFFVRVLFFVCFFLGLFCLLGWLAITESWQWFVAMGVLAIHQFAFARANVYVVWGRPWLYVVIGLGTWVYLHGGALATIAVCTVGALVTIAILSQWYMMTSWRFEDMRRLHLGPFDQSRRRRLW